MPEGVAPAGMHIAGQLVSVIAYVMRNHSV